MCVVRFWSFPLSIWTVGNGSHGHGGTLFPTRGNAAAGRAAGARCLSRTRPPGASFALRLGGSFQLPRGVAFAPRATLLVRRQQVCSCGVSELLAERETAGRARTGTAPGPGCASPATGRRPGAAPRACRCRPACGCGEQLGIAPPRCDKADRPNSIITDVSVLEVTVTR